MSNTLHERPSGLVIPIRARVSGRLSWRVLDERGAPEIPRSPTGFALAPAEGVTQRNLITDLGLNAIGTIDMWGGAFRNYFHVGESSAAPAATDTALGAEVQRGTTVGQQGAAHTYGYDAANDLFAAEIVVNKALTMTSNRNLTEFGFGSTDNADVYVRALFRDLSDNPITIPLLTGKTIDVVHRLRLEVDAPDAGDSRTFDLERYDATDTLTDTTPFAYTFGPWSNDTSSANIQRIFTAWSPAGVFSGSLIPFSAAGSYAPIMPTPSTFPGIVASVTTDAYVSLSYERVKHLTHPTSYAVGNIYGFAMKGGADVTPTAGFIALLDSPASFAKAASETLTLTFVSSWARG